MSVNFEKTFGATAKPADKKDLPKANFWLNIGYSVTVDTDQGTEERFVSLPMGIPVDTQELLPTNSRNQDWAAFSAARNNLLEQITEYGKTLKPGEDAILNLQIQLRRVNEEAPAATADNNPFVRKLALA
jgi:hypothetical protein